MRRTAVPALTFGVCLTAYMAQAQSTGNSMATVFDPAKSGVKVVFAPQKEAAPPKTAAGQRAHVDPQGKLKEPDPEESQILNNEIGTQFSATPQNVVPIYGPNGTVSVRLGDEYMQVATVTIDADGQLRFECAPATKQGGLKQAAPVSKAAEKAERDVK